jgi:hypothetical protein
MKRKLQNCLLKQKQKRAVVAEVVDVVPVDKDAEHLLAVVEAEEVLVVEEDNNTKLGVGSRNPKPDVRKEFILRNYKQ